MTWDDRACRDVDPRVFFGKDPHLTAAALEICRPCPVRVECADYRLEVEAKVGGQAVGVWAGVRFVEDTSSDRAEGRAA